MLTVILKVIDDNDESKTDIETKKYTTKRKLRLSIPFIRRVFVAPVGSFLRNNLLVYMVLFEV
jgi:hypothetical protein